MGKLSHQEMLVVFAQPRSFVRIVNAHGVMAVTQKRFRYVSGVEKEWLHFSIAWVDGQSATVKQ